MPRPSKPSGRPLRRARAIPWPRVFALLTLAWVGVIAFCMYFGRLLGPWLQGAGRLYTVAALSAAGLAGLALAAWRLLRLPVSSRGARVLVLAGAGLGLAITAWAQPLLIERTHLLLYGVLGLVAYGAMAGRPPGWSGLLAAGCFCALVGLLDEWAQHLHPQRVGDPRDVISNTLAALLALAAMAALGPAPLPARPRRYRWAILAGAAWLLGLAGLFLAGG